MYRPNIPRDINHPRFAQEVEVSLGLLFNQLQQVQLENNRLKDSLVAQAVQEAIPKIVSSNGLSNSPVALANNSQFPSSVFEVTSDNPINITQLVGEAADPQKAKVENFTSLPTAAQLLAEPDLQAKQLFRVGTSLYVVDDTTSPPTAKLLGISSITELSGSIEVRAVNITPVTANSSTTLAQNLMSYSIPAGLINTLGKTLRLTISGLYDIDTAATVTWSIDIGTVTVLSWTPVTPAGVVTDLPFRINAEIICSATGATGTVEAHGVIFAEDKKTAGHSSDKPQLDLNTAASAAINLTTAQTMTVKVTFNTASANNKVVQRVMITELLKPF